LKLGTFRIKDGVERLGVVVGEKIADVNAAYVHLLTQKGKLRAKEIADALLPSEMVAFLKGGDDSWKALSDVAGLNWNDDPSLERFAHKIEDVTLACPVTNPGKIACVGANYFDLLEEMGIPPTPAPRLFAKFSNALCGPCDPIIRPAATECLDYEAELAFVVGKTARRVPKEKAFEHIAGYMILNDVSARDLQVIDKQFLRAKTFDHFAPCGPFLVSRDEVPNPDNLDVKLWVNGDLRQNSNTNKMVFDVATILSFISHAFTLEPGDIVATGTPGGLGRDRTPPVYMQHGDVCSIEIEKIGKIENKVVPELFE